ncbi:MAG: hypothetical protein F4151_14480 [Gammaproteobacteria bacterium]|nr:hypothetical protein [Gammaproteobacteria bacterium]
MAPDPRRRRARLPTALLLPLVVASLPIPAHGQQPPDSIPPPGPPDTTVVVDSARVQVLQVLQRLAAPPLPDSLRELPDSTVRASRPVAPGPDSVLNALLSLPGYQASQYEGAGLEFGSSGEVVLYGNPDARARFFREGAERMQLEADSSITMDDSTNLIWTEGASVFTGREGEPLNSTSMIYSLDSQRGTAYSARTRFAEGGSPWNVFGDLPSVTPEIVHGAHVGFTSCDLEHPHYHFDTSEIKIVAGNMLVARSVKLYFADVPVFWFPFMFQSIERGRASGILTPRFSVNDIVRSSAGYSRRVSNLGFYWAINDYADASVAMDWWADNYVGVTGTLNYSWLRQFLRGNVNFRNFWRQDGSTTLAFSTSHNWELDERTRFEIRSSYASSTDFVRQNSFDPREVTQSIDSQGGINRRFDWGNVSMSANRRQFLSDDRVSLTLPSANLSLSPITFFSAPSSRASWYNNIIWTGSGNYTRSIEDRLDQPPGEFKESLADKENTRGGLSSSLSLGALSLSHSLSFNEAVTRDGLEVLAPAAGLAAADRLEAWFGSVVAPAADSALPERVDLSSTDLTWSQTLSYQQRLIGTTTFTPNLSMSGKALQTNKIPEAGSLVSAPTRLSFGAGLKTDIYGLWPGVGGFSAIRHKLSPGFDYSYAPAVTQTQLQNAVFGRGEFRAKNEMRIRLNQTFEAKRETEESEEEEGEAPPDPSGEPRRRERAEIVQLLALQTSAVNYDFVRADSLGQFTDGFTTTTLSNSISSDFLRGLEIRMEHLLFDESGQTGEGRKFAPHLSGLDLSFSLNAASPPLRWIGGLIGLGGDGEADPEPDPEEDDLLEEEDPFSAASGLDESQIVPGFGDTSRDFGRQSAQGRPGGGGGGWDANVSYSLQRPRQADLVRQMVQLNVRFEPTELWRASWRTSYDVALGSFNDHMITFTRQLHRWEANFDFRRTVTGNWAFRFEVALSDNRDLKFDYQQYDRSDPLANQFR